MLHVIERRKISGVVLEHLHWLPWTLTLRWTKTKNCKTEQIITFLRQTIKIFVQAGNYEQFFLFQSMISSPDGIAALKVSQVDTAICTNKWGLHRPALVTCKDGQVCYINFM